jgi:ferredoxin-type protein NapG
MAAIPTDGFAVASMKAMPKENTRRPQRLSRRKFLQGVCGAGIMLGLGGLAIPAKSAASLLRPPGGQDPKWFEALCLKCNKCLEICPTNVVALARLEDGLLLSRTPVLNFHLGYCTLCGKCVDVCPTGALKPQDPKTVKLGVAQVDEENCIAWQWGGCTACKLICKYEAISLDASNRPVVNQSKCNGCGQCEYICPAVKLRSLKVGQSRGIVIVPLQGSDTETVDSRAES